MKPLIFKNFLATILILFPNLSFPKDLAGKKYYLNISSKNEILDCLLCYENNCKPVLDFIFPLNDNKYLIVMDTNKNFKKEKIYFLNKNKKYKKYILNDSNFIDLNGDTIFLPSLDIKNYNYIFGKDENNNWKLTEIIPKINEKTNENFLIQESNNNFKNKKNKIRSIYLWDTINVLGEKKSWNKIIDKLNCAKINKIYMQIPYEINSKDEFIWYKKRASKLFDFIILLLQRNIEIEFLDGWKGFALEPVHNRVLFQIENLKIFWQKYFPRKPFPALHLDVEPYLLRFYNNQTSKEIYFQYISLLMKIKNIYPDLEIIIDIPFWLDKIDFGEEILKNILKYSNGINVMAYRSNISGKNGIIYLIEKEVELANKENKKITIGIETMKLENEKLYTINELKDENSLFFLQKTKIENLFLISKEKSEYGLKLFADVSGEFISFNKYNWDEINKFVEEIFSFYGENIDGVSFHHWGSLKGKIKCP